MWTKAELQGYATEVATFVSTKVVPVVSYLATNQTAVGIESAIPYGATVVKALGGVNNILKIVGGDLVPGLNFAFAAYDVYKAEGGAPMDASGIAKMKPEDNFA